MASSLTAAELQARFEGAPDPFPSLVEETARPVNGNGSTSSKIKGQSAQAINTSSEDAFPSLGAPSAAPAASKPAFSWSASSKVKSKPAGPPVQSDTLSVVVGHQTDKDGKTIALGAIMKQVQDKTTVSLEASTQKSTGLTTFVLKSTSVKAIAEAKKLLTARLSKVVTLVVEAPISTLGSIIGPKGATLKQITDSTGCKINIPKREDVPSAPPTNGHTTPVDSDDEDAEAPEEPVVEITINGPESSAREAEDRIRSIVGVRTSKATTRIKDIPSSFFPFISGKLYELSGGRDVKINVPPPAILKAFAAQAAAAAAGDDEATEQDVSEGAKKKDLAIIVSGEKAAVAETIEDIRAFYDDLRSSTTTLNFGIPKRQHRFLVGSNAEEILSSSGCIVELPSIEDPSDNVIIRGPSQNLSNALNLVMTRANAVAVEVVDLASVHRPAPADPVLYGKSLVRYLVKTSQLRKLQDAHSPVKIYAPFPAAIDATGQVQVEIVGEDREKVKAAKVALTALVKNLAPSAIEHVEIDCLVHRFLIGKRGSKVNQLHSQHGVEVIFPVESLESSDVVLVYSSPEPTEKKARDAEIKTKLALVKDELLKLAKDAADIKTSTLDVPSQYHRAIVGTGGTVLNALIGEDRLVSVSVGAGKGKTDGADADTVTIRGPSSDVQRVEKEILQIVEDAKNDAIVNGHVAEFSVDRSHVGHLVGSSGSAINKLRDELGVKVNFDDAAAPATASADKKKKPAGAKAICKIVGRKEAVEEAKRRLLAQVERLADETTVSVVIPKKFHSGLIGTSGKFAIRLEDKYAVKITFPKADREGTGAEQKADEVIIRGGKKGVAGAKAELLEAAEYEKEIGYEETFTIPSRAVARVLGKAGSQINEIKDETDTQIDLDKADSSKTSTSVTVRGSKKDVKAARAKIIEIAETVGEEATLIASVENQYHRNLIGPGGSRLREIIVSCGGPAESNKQAGLVHFPKGNDAADEVRLRGEPSLVKKLKAELERLAAEFKDRVVLGVSVPAASHASKIGRGGSALLELQKKTGATIQFPGSRQYDSFGKIENASELGETDPKSIVKVAGSKTAVAAAIEELSKQTDAPAARAPREGGGKSNDVTQTVTVPERLVAAIAGDKGFFFRNLRNAGVFVDSPPTPPKAPAPRPTKSGAPLGRIDDEYVPLTDVEYMYEVFPRYGSEDDGKTVEWTLRSRKQEDLDRGVKTVERAIQKAEKEAFIGVLVGLPQSAFPRIVGTKGATVSRLRAETGAEIFISRDDSNVIELTGDEESVRLAKEAILEIAARPDREQRERY